MKFLKSLKLLINSRKEVTSGMLAKLYAMEIANGELTFAKVPKFLRKKVKRELERMELPELAEETAE